MASVENLMQVAQNAGQKDIPGQLNTDIPFRWMAHPEIQPLIELQAPQTFEDVPHTLPINRVPEAVHAGLSQEYALSDTIEFLFPGKKTGINKVDSMLVQMGRKAYIVACQVETSSGNAGFAIYLGRNPNGTELGNEAETDFHNLRSLHTQAEQKLTPKGKRKYKFLNPIALLPPITIGGHAYSSFSMPFVEGYGELRADIYENLQLLMRLPFFRYSVKFSKRLKDHNDATYKQVVALDNTYRHLLHKFPDKPQEYALMQLTRSPQFQMIKKQMRDVLIGNALIFLLSDGYFPKDFMINAGDWMVNFTNDGLYLYLISVRGGWEYLGFEKAWQERMKQQTEIVPGREMEGVSMPIFYGQDDLIATAMADAKKLLT